MRKEQTGSHQRKICMSGFRNDPEKEEKYVQMIEELGGLLDNNLGNGTDVLIVNNVASEKYHTAKDCKPIPHIVSIQWLTDSHHHKDRGFLPYPHYLVKDIFYQMRVGIFGFAQNEFDIFAKIIRDGKGTPERLESLDKEKLAGTFQVIMISKREQKRVDLEQFEDLDTPIVGPLWFQRCLDTKRCIFPEIYSLNHQKQSMDESFTILTTAIAKKLNTLFDRVQINDPSHQFLNNTFIHVFQFQARPCQIIKDIVSCYGGVYMDKFSSIVTHIIPCSYSEDDYTQFTKYGDQIEIVKLKWLIDCVMVEKRLPEVDYVINKGRYNMVGKADQSPVKINTGSNMVTHSEQLQSSNGYHTLNMMKRQSISFSQTKAESKPERQMSIDKFTTKREEGTKMFDNRLFFVMPTQAKQLKEIIKLIRLHDGKLIDSISKSLKEVFIVMIDSSSNESLLEKFNKYSSVIKPVSERWVKKCHQIRAFLDPQKQNFFIFKPFSVPTPFGRLVQCRFRIMGFEELMKMRIRQLLQVVGNGRPVKIMQQITHVICQPNTYKDDSTYEELKKENPKVYFVKLNWILHSINQKEVLREEDFLVEPRGIDL